MNLYINTVHLPFTCFFCCHLHICFMLWRCVGFGTPPVQIWGFTAALVSSFIQVTCGWTSSLPRVSHESVALLHHLLSCWPALLQWTKSPGRRTGRVRKHARVAGGQLQCCSLDCCVFCNVTMIAQTVTWLLCLSLTVLFCVSCGDWGPQSRRGFSGMPTGREENHTNLRGHYVLALTIFVKVMIWFQLVTKKKYFPPSFTEKDKRHVALLHPVGPGSALGLMKSFCSLWPCFPCPSLSIRSLSVSHPRLSNRWDSCPHWG